MTPDAIPSLRYHFTPIELQTISDALEYYGRSIKSNRRKLSAMATLFGMAAREEGK